MYRIGDTVVVNDRMQRNYRYEIVARSGEGFLPDFKPKFSPREMLAMGVFEGKYCNDCRSEFPEEWFVEARISDQSNPDLNYFGVKSRQPLSYWKERGWIFGPDSRGFDHDKLLVGVLTLGDLFKNSTELTRTVIRSVMQYH
jgi:hypothetical protein